MACYQEASGQLPRLVRPLAAGPAGRLTGARAGVWVQPALVGGNIAQMNLEGRAEATIKTDERARAATHPCMQATLHSRLTHREKRQSRARRFFCHGGITVSVRSHPGSHAHTFPVPGEPVGSHG